MKRIFLGLLALGALATSSSGCGDLEGEEGAGGSVVEREVAALTLGTPTYDTNTQCSFAGLPTAHCCPNNKVMVGFHGTSNVLKCMDFAETLTFRFPDRGTQADVAVYGNPSLHTVMHVCPAGSVQVGIHAAANLLICQAFTRNATATSTFKTLDLSTKDSQNPAGIPQMHVCPGGLAMFGIHVGKNQLACFSDASGLGYL
jgi:hypothetical protein